MRNGTFTCILVLLVEALFAQYQSPKFESFSTMEGLSSSTCLDVFQDSDGFMWFGTIDGLNKYNGYSFTVYRPVLDDPYSVSDNRINCIEEDNNGNLWVGTNHGLNVFNRDSEKFYRIKFKDNGTSINAAVNELLYDDSENAMWVATEDGARKIPLDKADFSLALASVKYNTTSSPSSIDNNNVTSVLQDRNKQVWLGTAGKYLNRYDSKHNNFERVLINVPISYELDHIPRLILADKEGDFWIGNNLATLVLWHRKTDKFEEFGRSILPADQKIPIFDIYQDRKGIIWVATDGYGIYLLDKRKGIVQHIVHNPADPFSPPNNQHSKVLEDKNGIFWIGSYNKGVSKLVVNKPIFAHYYYQEGCKNCLSSRIAQAVLQDKKGRIWIGADGGGLNLFDEKSKTFKHFQSDQTDPYSLSSNKILYLLESRNGYIWVCTWDGGVNKFDPETGKAVRYRHDPLDAFSLGQNTVWCGVEDSSNRLWFGTLSGGLNLFDPHTSQFYKFTNIPSDSGVAGNFVFTLFIDSKNRLFVGTETGLSVLDLNNLDSYIPEHPRFQQVTEKNIVGNRINYVVEDNNGNIWTGTGLGLHKLSPDLKLLESYSTKDGISNNIILGIEQDNQGNLWLINKKGLSVLNPDTKKIRNFDVYDGLQGMEFQSKSIDKLKDGRIIIGGINGFNIFDPAVVENKPDRLRPIITSFKILNKTVKAGDTINKRILLQKSISKTNHIRLKYNENHISFEFAALYYSNPQKIEYAYKMKGLDEDYIFSQENRTANYSNLVPGEYTFEIKASLDGEWDNAPVTAISINVLPPPWKTWWAYTIYTILLIVLTWVLIRYYTKIVREEKEHELDQKKLSFFINVSHEFRTPLTLILNPIDKILSSYSDPEEVKASALVAQRSATRLLNLVNQLLDFRKMDLGKAPLETVSGDLVKFINDIFLLFDDLARMKGIRYHFDAAESELVTVFDPDKIEKIITNLLSNAIKFTESGGYVILSISKSTVKETSKSNLFSKNKQKECIIIKVEDTGIGIKKEYLKDVFTRFFHADSSQAGTGIGLNFTKGLVELHGGNINVESKHGEGTVFTVTLPVKEQPKRKIAPKKEIEELGHYTFNGNYIKATEYEVAISNDENTGEDYSLEENESRTTRSAPVILIVEDNKELRLHLKNDLKKQFKVKEAVNGVEGLEKVQKYYPDMVISDVVMPEMDGFELCRKIKSEIDICHIPVILLTARSQEADRIEGYNTGADEYLPKPFNMMVLKARINNLLDAKNRLREKFALLTDTAQSIELKLNNLDEKFLDQATKVVLENVSDPDFGLENLLLQVGMSRSQFFRKINSLTGQNPSNFIRTVRLKYAAEELLKRQHSIKEISYLSGFSSTAYFIKTFRELFGQTPSQYIEQKEKKV